MKFLLIRSVILSVLTVASVAAQTSITGISPTTAPRSSRLLIHGNGFGATQGSGHVTIGGITAPLTRWSDTLIAAYVPEAAITGTANVQVFNSNSAASNLSPISVTARQALTGHTLWRFQADGDYIRSRPAVAGDGTVYTQDVYGHLYALDPTGGLKWIFNSPGSSFGNISVGPDGTIYTGSTDSIFALAPNGVPKWQFNQNPAAFILLGPNVGPDGNIYAVGTQGIGAFSLTPQGTLRWTNPEVYDRPIITLQDIVFPSAQTRMYFHANRHLRGVGFDGTSKFTFVDALDVSQGDSQPAVASDGSVYSNLFMYPGPGIVLAKFDSNGNQLWHIFDQFTNSTNLLSTVDIGPDGTVYDGRNLSELYAINSNGTQRWKYTDTGILSAPVVSPLNDLIFVGGIVTYGQPGFFEAVSTAGSSLWKQILPIENGLNITPMSRSSFTADGHTAYIGTSIAGQTSDGYSYLYAVQTSTGGPAVSLSPASLSFGTQRLKTTSAPRPSVLTNTGTSPLTISAIVAGGDFAQTNNCPIGPITLPAGGTCTITVTFLPTAINGRSGTVTITDDAPNSPQSLKLSGTGTVITMSPSSLNFGQLKVNTQGAPMSTVLRNWGTTPVTISSVTIGGTNPGDFAMASNTCVGSVAAKGTCTLTIVMKPTAIGTRRATLTVRHNGGGGSSSVALVGTGK